MSRNKKKINIGVVFGGRSGEHEVSIVSAGSVIQNLDKKKYQIIPLGITKEGKWIYKNSPMKQLKAGVKKGSGGLILPEAVVKKIDVFFPVLHGTYGEDGTIQGMFEMWGKAYVGAGVLGSSIAMDKTIQKGLFAEAGLKQVKYDWFMSRDWRNSKKRPNILRRLRKLHYPMFIKPASLGSSVGISKVNNKQQLIKAINLAARYDHKVIIEQGARNPRELQCAVLGNDRPKASVIGEVVPKNDFYDFEAKYYDDKTEYYFPAKNLSKSLIKQIQKVSIDAYKVLNISGMARVEFFSSGQTLYVNEANTIPGFTSHSIYPQLWQASGLSYKNLLTNLVELGLERYNDKERLSTEFDSGSDWYK